MKGGISTPMVEGWGSAHLVGIMLIVFGASVPTP